MDQVARRPQDGGDGFGAVGGEGKGRGGDSDNNDLDGNFNVGIEDSNCGGCDYKTNDYKNHWSLDFLRRDQFYRQSSMFWTNTILTDATRW